MNDLLPNTLSHPATHHYRTIWLSDIHLGTRGCKAEYLIDFLRHNDAQTIYLVGDALALEEHLARLGIDRLCAVVSSLPIKWFSLADQRQIVEPCLVRLGPDGRFLQMTNAFSSPIAKRPLGIAGRPVARVWRNLPPSQIWAYSTLSDTARETA